MFFCEWVIADVNVNVLSRNVFVRYPIWQGRTRIVVRVQIRSPTDLQYFHKSSIKDFSIMLQKRKGKRELRNEQRWGKKLQTKERDKNRRGRRIEGQQEKHQQVCFYSNVLLICVVINTFKQVGLGDNRNDPDDHNTLVVIHLPRSIKRGRPWHLHPMVSTKPQHRRYSHPNIWSTPVTNRTL